ncbi:MAG TPA: HAMP domain-containing sensor histidine kinase [Acidimicrobiales bacterium]|jgi:two-component system, OmpR family, sensor histidine kinase MtrB|nr:HAMP domain-containing sensor histidine kinase [Acidimicrobiales bacterium]
MRRLRRLPLRARTSLAFGLTALLLSTLLATIAYALVRQSLLEERSSAAMRQAFTNARLVRSALRSPTVDTTALLAGLRVGPRGDALVRVRGEWFASSVSLDRGDVPAALRTGVERGHAGRQRVIGEEGPQLVVGVPIVETEALYFEVTSLEEVQRSLDVLGRSLTVGAAVAALVGAAVGAASSAAVLRPLRRMAGVARSIVDGDVESRLDAEGDRDLEPLVDSFNVMLDDLRERIRREAQFASDVAHELRGPLAALASAVDVVNRRKAELPERAVYAVEVLEDQVRSFNRLVLDLLEISRFDAGAARLDRERIDLQAFLHAIVEERNEQVQLAVAAEAASVRGDRRRLHQVFWNLLDNARNYAGGATRIETERVEGAVRIAVADAGPGVDPADRYRIFERFDRGHLSADQDAPKGTGLGLALVAEHVRLHGGRVWVEPASPSGSRFVVELPEEATS